MIGCLSRSSNGRRSTVCELVRFRWALASAVAPNPVAAPWLPLEIESDSTIRSPAPPQPARFGAPVSSGGDPLLFPTIQNQSSTISSPLPSVGRVGEGGRMITTPRFQSISHPNDSPKYTTYSGMPVSSWPTTFRSDTSVRCDLSFHKGQLPATDVARSMSRRASCQPSCERITGAHSTSTRCEGSSMPKPRRTKHFIDSNVQGSLARGSLSIGSPSSAWRFSCRSFCKSF